MGRESGPKSRFVSYVFERLEGPTSPELVLEPWIDMVNFTISWVVTLKNASFYPTHRGDVAN